MKIIDENGVEIENPDKSLGYLVKDTQVIHHEAIEEVEEKFYYTTIKEYPNGGKDVRKIIEVPGVEAKEAWDDLIPVYRYVLYTPEELAQIEAERTKPTLQEQVTELREALELLLSGVTK